MVRSHLVGLVLVVAVGALPMAPPEHVHEADDHGHLHVLVHRHLAPHTGAHGDATHGTLDDHDPPALTLHAVYTVPIVVAIGQPPRSLVATLQPPDGETVHRAREYVERLIHGPPRAPTSLRAPPALSRL